jgi:hypothetical protein
MGRADLKVLLSYYHAGGSSGGGNELKLMAWVVEDVKFVIWLIWVER